MALRAAAAAVRPVERLIFRIESIMATVSGFARTSEHVLREFFFGRAGDGG